MLYIDGELTLSIELGNAEMSEPKHAADALRRAAKEIEEGFTFGAVQDTNGNTCGSWGIGGTIEDAEA